MIRLQYFHNIFTINYRCKVVIYSKLNLKLKLLFYLSIITNNNLLFKICYKSIVVVASNSVNSVFGGEKKNA